MDRKIELLKNFLETNPHSRRALSLLAKGVEIGLTVENTALLALVITPTGPQLVERPANNPDVTFFLNHTSIDFICRAQLESPEDLAVVMLKQLKSKNIRLAVTGSFIGIATNGYFSLIRLGGKKMWDFLAEHGITSFFKITNIIKDLIKNRKP